MQQIEDHPTKELASVEFLQTSYDEINPSEPLYSVGHRKIYLKDMKSFLSASDVNEKQSVNLIVKKIFEEGRYDALKNLIEYGYCISVFNEMEETVIHAAFRYYTFSQLLYKDKGKLLFTNADDFNVSDCYGLSHFHIACALGNTVVVKKYLKNNADFNAQSDHKRQESAGILDGTNGFTPLHYAVKNHRYEIVKLLLEHGADVEIKDDVGRTAFYLTALVDNYRYPSCWENDLKIIEILIKYGSDVNAKDNKGYTAILYLFWHRYYLNMNVLYESEFDVESNTLIDKTIEVDFKQRQKEILEIYIKNGADISLIPEDGFTLLHHIVDNLETIRKPNTFEDISFDDTLYLEVVKLILTTNSEIDVNLKNNSGESPLSLAVSYMSFDIVKLLLSYTMDLSGTKLGLDTIKTNYINTVPTFECARNLIAIVELLLDRGYNLTLEDNLAIMKFLIHGIDECNCHCNIEPTEIGFAINLYSPIHISCFNDVVKQVRMIGFDEFEDLQLNLELIEYAKLFIHEDIKNEIKTVLLKYDIPFTRNSHRKLRLKEINDMKSVNLQDDVDLYDVMTKHPYNIYRYIENIIFDEKLFESFDLFKPIIKGHFAKSVVRHYVEKSAHNYLQISLFSLLSDVCCRKILSYLNNKDIYNLCLTILDYGLDACKKE